jgi:hypothetical protein
LDTTLKNIIASKVTPIHSIGGDIARIEKEEKKKRKGDFHFFHNLGIGLSLMNGIPTAR